MQRRIIPTTNIEVSAICLGSMNWGQQCSEEDAHEQLDYAISQGINFIDTAELYPIPPDKEKQGRTEAYIGTWLKKRGRRDDLIIASKVSISEMIGTRALPDGRSRLNKRNIVAAVDGSLARLQTDYIDLYQTHGSDRQTNAWGVRGFEALTPDENAVPIEETLDAISEIVKSGKIRHFGVSNETAWGLMKHLEVSKERNLPHAVTIQNQYSLLNRTFEIGLSEVCLRGNVGLLPYSALSMGVLTGKYLNGQKPAGSRFSIDPRREFRYNPPHVQPAAQKYVDLARAHGLDPAQMALAWVTSRPFVIATIVGATSMEQLRTDIKSADVQLPKEVLDGIAEIYRENPDPHA